MKDTAHWQFWMAEDFVEHHFETPKWLVDQLLPAETDGVIFGEPGAFKTQFSLTMARALINGEMFLERFQCRFSSVCYVHVDKPPHTLQGRISSFIETLSSPENFCLVTANTGGNLTQEDGSSEWVQQVREFNPDVIFFDTLRKIHMLDENAAPSAHFLYDHLKRLFGEDKTRLYNHHDRKWNQSQMGASQMQKAAGNLAWQGDAQLGIHLAKRGRGPTNKLLVSFPRVTEAEEPHSMKCVRDPHTGLIGLDPEEMTSYDKANIVLRDDPSMSEGDLASKLMSEFDLSKAQAYRAAGDAVSRQSHG